MWFRIGAGGVVDWIDVVQDRGRWGAVNAVMNLGLEYHAGNFLTS